MVQLLTMKMFVWAMMALSMIHSTSEVVLAPFSLSLCQYLNCLHIYYIRHWRYVSQYLDNKDIRRPFGKLTFVRRPVPHELHKCPNQCVESDEEDY